MMPSITNVKNGPANASYANQSGNGIMFVGMQIEVKKSLGYRIKKAIRRFLKMKV